MMGGGGGYKTVGGRGRGHVKFHPYKKEKGGGGEVLAMYQVHFPYHKRYFLTSLKSFFIVSICVQVYKL